MPNTEFHEYEDSPSARAELVAFLEQTGDLPAEQGTWSRRLAHWWDENPFAALHPYRGRIMRANGRVIGYGGTIPAGYALNGRQVPVLLASTLRADPAYPKAGLPMLLKMRKLSQEVPIFHTTPIVKLQHALEKMDAVCEKCVRRSFFATGNFARLLGARSRWPTLDASMTLIMEVDQARAVQRPWCSADRLEKWTTLQSLNWYLSTPTRQQRFIGAVDAQGTLHSFLVLSERTRHGIHTWDIVESFTTRDTAEEVLALAGALVWNPALLPGGGHLLTVAAFPSDQTWDDMPSLMTRDQQVCHYFMMPESLRGVPKLTMMAEGDLVL